MAVHVPLKNVFTEYKKYHNFMTWLIMELEEASGCEGSGTAQQ